MSGSLLALLSLTCGMILDTATRGRRERERVGYLSVSVPRRSVASKTRRGRHR